MGTDTLQQQQQQQQQEEERLQVLIQQDKNYTDIDTKRILIVNYENDVNFALKLVLEEKGKGGVDRNKKNCYYFRVDCSDNPISVLRNFKNGFYDLLIISLVMPQMNGFEFAKEIRNIDDRVKLCFLIAGEVPGKVRYDPSSGEEEGEEVEREEAYEDKYIRLPIENKVLMEQIDRMIK